MYFVFGTVIDSISSLPIENAHVGPYDLPFSDSHLFEGDSLGAEGVLMSRPTPSDGSFMIQWFGYRDSTKVRLLLAYKSGYRICRFDLSPVEIRQMDEWRDEVTIRLATKN